MKFASLQNNDKRIFVIITLRCARLHINQGSGGGVFLIFFYLFFLLFLWVLLFFLGGEGGVGFLILYNNTYFTGLDLSYLKTFTCIHLLPAERSSVARRLFKVQGLVGSIPHSGSFQVQPFTGVTEALRWRTQFPLYVPSVTVSDAI